MFMIDSVSCLSCRRRSRAEAAHLVARGHFRRIGMRAPNRGKCGPKRQKKTGARRARPFFRDAR
jgi:hypothetical protein